MKVIVASKVQPHELLNFAVGVLIGLNYLLATIPAPQSLASVLPSWVVLLWAVGLVVSGCTGLFAIFYKRDAEFAFELERGSLYISSGVLLLLIGSVLIVSPRLTLSLGYLVGWIIANVYRATQLTSDLQIIRKEKAGGLNGN